MKLFLLLLIFGVCSVTCDQNTILRDFIHQVNDICLKSMMSIAADKQKYETLTMRIGTLLQGVPQEVSSTKYQSQITDEHWMMLKSIKRNIDVETFEYDDGGSERNSMSHLNTLTNPTEPGEYYTVFSEWLYKAKHGDKLNKKVKKSYYQSLVGTLQQAVLRLKAYKTKMALYYMNFRNEFYVLH